MSDIAAHAGTLRSALAASMRLAVRGERWFVLDVLGGVAAYAIWVAGTAALGMQVATLAEYEVAQGGTPTEPVLALVALLWLALPAIAGAAHLRSRILNIRGNVDRQYRVDRPGTLLAAPVAVVLVLAVGTVLASGVVGTVLLILMLPASLFLLVRTAAFSYRVYAFSHPTLVHVGVCLTLFVHAGVTLAYLGLANGQGALVEAAVASAGFDNLFAAEVDLVIASRPSLIVVAVLVPIALASAYSTAQRITVAVARRRERDVDPAALRTGQRYPPWWDVERAGMTPSVAGGRSATDGAGTSAANGGVPADAPPADDGDAGSSGDVDDGGAPGSPSIDEPIEPDDESPVEDAGHTRVYTPPSSELGDTPRPERSEGGDADDATDQDGRAVERDDEPVKVGSLDSHPEGAGGDHDERPRDGGADDGRPSEDSGEGAASPDGTDPDDGVAEEPTAVVDDGRRCWSCDTELPADTEVNYCPQCGEKIL